MTDWLRNWLRGLIRCPHFHIERTRLSVDIALWRCIDCAMFVGVASQVQEVNGE